MEKERPADDRKKNEETRKKKKRNLLLLIQIIVTLSVSRQNTLNLNAKTLQKQTNEEKKKKNVPEGFCTRMWQRCRGEPSEKYESCPRARRGIFQRAGKSDQSCKVADPPPRRGETRSVFITFYKPVLVGGAEGSRRGVTRSCTLLCY